MSRRRVLLLHGLAWLAMNALGAIAAANDALCEIAVIDAENGWPVPLVTLRTTHQATLVTDNGGLIAFDLPELMGRESWFAVEGRGYDVPADGMGYRGVRLTPTPGGKLIVRVERKFPGKRLGRLTGSGIFAESQRLGLELDWKDQEAFGCDSVQTALHNNRIYWAWGDTVLRTRPVGLFHMIGATTPLRPLDSFEPPVRLRYRYFNDEVGRLRVVAKMPGPGPTWLSGFASLPDEQGHNRLVAAYVKIKTPMIAYERGLCVWNESTKRFDHVRTLWSKTAASPRAPKDPRGHAVRWTDADGRRWILFGDPFPILRCAPTFEAWSDPQQWESLAAQSSVQSHVGNEAITPHRGSIAWNEYRQKWVAIFTQLHGKESYLGEIWYAEAESPLGPWGPAIQVASHPNYSFYNPLLHSELTPADSPVLLFEGTYTEKFANRPAPTPRYDYNQVLYRLDLDELAPLLE